MIISYFITALDLMMIVASDSMMITLCLMVILKLETPSVCYLAVQVFVFSFTRWSVIAGPAT